MGKMKKKITSVSSRKSFTLIELLVVIAIIAILAAILMPALSASRERARTSACTNNLKNIGLIYISYAENNNDMPVPGWSNMYGSTYWPEHLMKTGYLGVKTTSRSKSIISKIHGNFLVCPSDPTPCYNPDTTPMNCSYGTNSAVTLGPYGVWVDTQNKNVNSKTSEQRYGYHTFTEIAYSKKKGSATPLMVDSSGFGKDPAVTPPGDSNKKGTYLESRGTGCEANTFDYWITPGKFPCFADIVRHNMKANTLFCDGHVSTVNGPMYSSDGHRYVQWLNPWVAHSVYR